MFRHVRIVSTVVAVAAGGMVDWPSPAEAANQIRYVSVTGSNGGPCTLAAPCRSLQRGVDVTPVNGELQILDSGEYGATATITKSMTISGNGNTVVGTGLVISNADTVVALRGFVLNGQGAVTNGVLISATATVHIERCVIHSFVQSGIAITAAAHVTVVDSIMRDSNRGLEVTTTAAAARVTIDGSRFQNNASNGIEINDGQAMVSRSVASGSGFNGVVASAGARVNVTSTAAAHNGSSGMVAGPTAIMTIDSSVSRGNSFGLRVFSGGAARISDSVFTDNTTGISNAGTVQTRQNNMVTGNTTELSGTAPVALGAI